MLKDSRRLGVHVGVVTLGAEGYEWYQGELAIETVAALSVNARNGLGLGDVFSGTRIAAQLHWPNRGPAYWLKFARAAAAFKAANDKLPRIADVYSMDSELCPVQAVA
jgi:sugar/nucleoside kinase (ribokinase family)